MEISVLIEPVAGNGYRATWGSLGIMAEGPTKDEALAILKQTIEKRLASGAEVRTLSIPGPEHPLAQQAGVFKDDPTFEEWQQAIAEYRRQRDAEPDLP